MNYKKHIPDILFEDFFSKALLLEEFKSLKGKGYKIKNWENEVMFFERTSTGKLWNMDIRQVHKAYIELQDFKTINFKPYVQRTHSPALGLLLTLNLLHN